MIFDFACHFGFDCLLPVCLWLSLCLFQRWFLPAPRYFFLPITFLVLTLACFLTILFEVFVLQISDYMANEFCLNKDNALCIIWKFSTIARMTKCCSLKIWMLGAMASPLNRVDNTRQNILYTARENKVQCRPVGNVNMWPNAQDRVKEITGFWLHILLLHYYDHPHYCQYFVSFITCAVS